MIPAATAGGSSPASASPARVLLAVRGESLHDRVTSLLMAIVMGATTLFGGLMLAYAATRAFAARSAAPLELIEVAGLGGGTPDGRIGESQTIPLDAAAANAASNSGVDASQFEEPAVMDTPNTVLDAALDVGSLLANLEPAEGALMAGGPRASRLGTGLPGYGFGGGDGSMPREQRWSVLFASGQTPEEYARQLDYFGIELATVNSPSTLVFASKLAADKPILKIAPAQSDNRLFFAWQGAGRKDSDVALLRKAGIEVDDKPILQFCPPQVEETLAQLEAAHKGLRPSEIRVTRFQVVPAAGGYRFQVVDQQPLR